MTMPSSGAGGPCNHCGRTHRCVIRVWHRPQALRTPLQAHCTHHTKSFLCCSCCWRRGPPAKPVLCNACGSRYLVKRSLDGYQPLQTRREGGSKAAAAAAKDSSGSEGSKPVARRAPAPAAGRAAKPKRAAQKRWVLLTAQEQGCVPQAVPLATSTCCRCAQLTRSLLRFAHLCSLESDWSSDVEDSQLSGGSASLSEDTGGSGPAAAAGARRAAAEARRQRSTSPAKAPRLDTSYITSRAQLKVSATGDWNVGVPDK